jgi:FHA domain
VEMVHCTITYDARNGWLLKDEKSKSGTWVHLKFDGVERSYPVLVWSGMLVKAGASMVHF